MSNKDYRDVPLAPLFGLYDLCKWSFYRAVIAELVATFLFLYTTILTVIGYKAQIDPDLASNVTACGGGGGVGSLGIAFAFGGMYFILVYCTAGISNGHINPAVTWGMLVARKFSLLPAVFYMVAQCVGGICGAALVKALHGEYYNKYGGGTNSVSAGYSISTGFCAEIMGTFILVYTVFSATDPKRIAKDSHILVLSPLAIGFSVFIVHIATIPITGTGINPARSLGPAVIYNRHKPLNELWIFWVGPFIGATIAAFYHEVILRAKAAKAFGSICNC